MAARAPKLSRVGLQAWLVRKPKPKALKAGIEPTSSEVMTPPKITRTVKAASNARMRKRVSPAPARRAVSTLAVRADGSLKLISVKDGPGRSWNGGNSHPAH